MAVDTPVPVAMQKHRSASLKAGLSNAEGVEAFLRIIDSQLRQAIVAPSGISLPVAVPYTQALALAPSIAAAQQTRNLHPRPSLNVPYKAPSNDTEVRLAAIWTDLLGVKDIGIDDNFFSLGGHSLMAVRLTFRIRSEFNVEFALNDLFQAPTIARMEDTILLHLASGMEDQSLLQLLNEIDESQTGAISLDLSSQ
jgi:acyl carrier protein